MASSNADLAKPFGTVAETNLRRVSAKIQVSKTKPVETAMQGTRAIFGYLFTTNSKIFVTQADTFYLAVNARKTIILSSNKSSFDC